MLITKYFQLFLFYLLNVKILYRQLDIKFDFLELDVMKEKLAYLQSTGSIEPKQDVKNSKEYQTLLKETCHNIFIN